MLRWIPIGLLCTGSSRKTATAPARQSARVRGLAADPALAAGVHWEGPGGTVLLTAGHAAAVSASEAAAACAPVERHPQGLEAVVCSPVAVGSVAYKPMPTCRTAAF